MEMVQADEGARFLATHREDLEGAAFGLIWLQSVNPHFSWDVDQWIWCSKCERVYSFLELRLLLHFGTRMVVRHCPVEGCTGRANPETEPETQEWFPDVLHSPENQDFHPWHPEEPPRKYNADYPAIPEAFGHYPMQRKTPY